MPIELDARVSGDDKLGKIKLPLGTMELAIKEVKKVGSNIVLLADVGEPPRAWRDVELTLTPDDLKGKLWTFATWVLRRVLIR